VSDPEDKKSIVPPPARSRGRRTAVKPLGSPAPPVSVPGQSGVEPRKEVFEVADAKWAPADADDMPIGYALALEQQES
jgi:hypothetical protein